MLVNVVNICEEGEWPSLLFSIWKSSDSAEAESGIASPSMSNLYPVMVPESELRNAEEGNGKRQWSGFVLSQKLFPDIDISSSTASSPPVVSSLSQESPMIVEQSSISEFSDVSSLRHPGNSNRETSKVAIVLWRDIGTAKRMDN